jgi:electron transfer flavoprotein beta subunit
VNIAVCMCRVPDTAARIRIAASGTSPDPEGMQYVINPYDEFAVEEAIKLKEKAGGKVTVVTIGAADAQKDIRACLAKGCDDAIHVVPSSPLDSLQTARLLAAEIGALNADAVFCGKQAVDDDSAAVGPMLAALLKLPCVTKVAKLEVTGTSFVATREIEGGLEEVEGSFPCVLTAEKGLNEPRRAGLKEIMGAKNKPLRTVNATPSPGLTTVAKLELPPERAGGKIVGEGKGAVPALVDLLRKDARVI